MVRLGKNALRERVTVAIIVHIDAASYVRIEVAIETRR